MGVFADPAALRVQSSMTAAELRLSRDFNANEAKQVEKSRSHWEGYQWPTHCEMTLASWQNAQHSRYWQSF